MKGKPLIEFLPYFSEALSKQIEEDQKRWGDTWQKVPFEGQVDRIYARFQAYKDQFDNAGTPIPWLKIAVLAMIAWIRNDFNE